MKVVVVVVVFVALLNSGGEGRRESCLVTLLNSGGVMYTHLALHFGVGGGTQNWQMIQ